MKKLISVTALGLSMSMGAAHAGIVTHTFDDGSDLSAFSPDRSAPAGFEIVNNELVMSIDGDAQPSEAFRQTQGMGFGLDAANYVAIDMYIDGDWTDEQRYAGLWGVGRDDLDQISAYPILEYQLGSMGGDIHIWDNAWVDTSALFTLNAFNTFAMQVVGGGIDYFLNGNLVYSERTSGTTSFSKLILNAKNEGTDFVVRYDNLVYGTVSEPGIWALLLVAAPMLWRRKR